MQFSIEGHVDKKSGSVFEPQNDKTLIIFIKDLNMASINPCGTQEHIALLLTLLDHGFMFSHTKELSQKIIKNLQFIAATSPQVNGQNSIDTRFVSCFNVIGLTEPDNEDLPAIFDSIIKAKFLEFSNIVKECTSKLTKATLKVFQWVQENLAPTPAKFHFIYSMRDVSRIYEGICSIQPAKVNSAMMLVKLWYHEVCRVLFNRLVTEED